MTISEARAHDKLLQAFGDRPFGRAEALAVVSEDLLSALVAAGSLAAFAAWPGDAGAVRVIEVEEEIKEGTGHIVRPHI